MTVPRSIGVVFALLISTVSHSQAEVITDAVGRRVLLEKAPRRIIPIFSSNAELVASLGLADRIVGIEALTRYPADLGDKPVIGGRLGFSVDAIVRQSPDLVIVTPARQAMHQILDPMSRLDIPVIVLLSRNVREVLDNLRLVGRATGVPERAEALASKLESRLRKVRETYRAGRPLRVVMITGRLGNGMVLIARGDTYTGDALRLAGAAHALEQTLVPQVSPEAVIAADPDVLLFAGTRQQLDELVTGPGWPLLRAVREGRVFTVSRAEFLIPGPRTVDGIEKLASLLWKTRGE
jgi:iron complex transport system substrate-binding protein